MSLPFEYKPDLQNKYLGYSNFFCYPSICIPIFIKKQQAITYFLSQNFGCVQSKFNSFFSIKGQFRQDFSIGQILPLTLQSNYQQINRHRMGSNPSKSQQLQSMFPQFRLLPELTSQQHNMYELFFVAKDKNVFIIKETDWKYNQSKHPNSFALTDIKIIDKTCFSIYQWYPQSVFNFLKANPNHLNQGFAIFLMAATLNVYCSYWKTNDYKFIDIRSENIKVGKKNSGITIKVLPPSVTRKTGQYSYQNTINYLGSALKQILQQKIHQFSPQISRIIQKMIKQKSNKMEIWKKYEDQVLQIQVDARKSGFSPTPQKKPIQNHSPIPINYASSQQRSTSPVPKKRIQVKINGQIHPNYSPSITRGPPQYYSQRPVSPINVHPINVHQQSSAITLHQHPQSFISTNKNEQNFQIYETQILEGEKASLLKSPSSKIQNFSEKQMKNTANFQNFLRSNGEGNNNVSPRHLAEVGNRYFPKELNKNTINEEKKNNKIIMNQVLQSFPFFQPSECDVVELKPKLGIPKKTYTPKTKQDKHQKKDFQENIHFHNQSSKTESNFMKKHLLPDKNDLNQSQIAIDGERSSSFGFSVSEESQSGVYDGNYDGEYHPLHSNVKHGIGKLILPSGGSYQGNFSWNRMDGWGKLFYPSGRLAYQGYWKKGKFQGYGKLFNENPQHIDHFDYTDFIKIQQENEEGYWKVYEGSMHCDMKQGHGIWILENGQKYDGEFRNDEVHGEGTFFGKKENIEGIWENNKLVYIRKRQ